MTNQTAIDALALQHRRFTAMLRSVDGGIWWETDVAAGLNAERIKAQADVIALALDELTDLMKKIAA